MATEFKLPEVGEGIESGTVVGVLVSVGDLVNIDQPVIELETDKAVVEVPSSVTGVVEAVNVKENEEAKVGQVILTLAEGQQAASPSPAVQSPPPAAPSPQPSAPPPVQVDPPAPVSSPTLGSSDSGSLQRHIAAAPSVRRLAREMGIDLRQVQGTGILNRVSASDVLRISEGGPVSAPSAPVQELPDFSKWGETERVPMSGIRKATVRTMTTAWTNVPMVTHFDKADSTEFEVLRKKYKPKAEAAGAKLTPTAMILKIMAGALKKFPDFNASIDTASNEIVYKQYVNIGVAVDTPKGLLVPVIKNADQKNIIELAKELGELAGKARERKLTPEDMQGGNFNISNLGGIGGTGFTPIVNPPDVAILGVARGGFEPVYNPESQEFEARLMMPFSLTYDHRLIDGAAAARFLRWVCQAIEDPFLMSLEG